MNSFGFCKNILFGQTTTYQSVLFPTYCVVCYRMIVAPYVRSVGHVFAYLYTLDDNSDRPIDYETSLLPKVFSLLHTCLTN